MKTIIPRPIHHVLQAECKSHTISSLPIIIHSTNLSLVSVQNIACLLLCDHIYHPCLPALICSMLRSEPHSIVGRLKWCALVWVVPLSAYPLKGPMPTSSLNQGRCRFGTSEPHLEHSEANPSATEWLEWHQPLSEWDTVFQRQTTNQATPPKIRGGQTSSQVFCTLR